MASGASWRTDVARGTTVHVRRGAEATWQPVGGPREAQGGAQSAATWQGATRPRGSTGRPCGAPHGRGLADGGPTGIVGPG